ncbi:hypothetical protein AB0F17_44320 [Nonomuraea sp. NPDC026600]|uniref:hypothetical protein n=1 Tax=Nonomuraea sp. NPDC026600 TaxID=3155363 RepID=UPI0033C81585
MADLDGVAPSTAANRRFRWWPGIILTPVAVVITLGMIEKRGVVIGIIAALTYGTLAIVGWIPPHRLMRWSRQHPVLDELFFAPLLFGGLAYLTPLSLVMCLVITAMGTALLLGLTGWIRRTRSQRATN